ncbi:MAG: hypothetical protein M1827_000116 [Pycnora praestabilis]|nr:MAG: hypothetical protein M1827_000116 [Pycnora praestabilis]
MGGRHNSDSSIISRIPTVREDSEDVELSHIVWRAQTTTAFPIPPLRSQSDTSTTSAPSQLERGREDSAVSLPAYQRRDPAYQRRDSLAPSLLAKARGSSPARSPTRVPLTSDDSCRTLVNDSEGSDIVAANKIAKEQNAIATDEKLLDFHKVVASNLEPDPEQEAQRRVNLDAQREALNQQQPTLKALREWANYEGKFAKAGPVRTLFSRLWHEAPSVPSEEKLISLAHHYFKPRGHIRVEVCDFGDGRAEHFTTTLGEVQRCWQEKPDWASVRWIHVPLSIGLIHSSVEDLFLHAGPSVGKQFKHGGQPGWPYLTTQTLSVHSREHFKEARDVFMLLKSKFPSISAKLDKTTFEGDNNKNLYDDIVWRADHLGTSMRFWDLAESDMSWQLAEGVGLGMCGPHSGLKPVDRHIDEQMLTRHPFYRKAQLVRDPFRCFHRADGCLLTLGPATGVNYLERRLEKFLQEPPESIFDNKDASALGQVWQTFSKTGTSTWHQDTVEWFLVYLMTEIEATPHTISQGNNAPSIHQGYQVIVKDLKRRRFDKWQRYESIKLVRDYITCTDELTLIVQMYAQKVDFFSRLKKDCQQFEAEETKTPNNPLGKSAVARIDWAVGVVEEEYVILEAMLQDLKISMSALFQLRSIEQNELAVVADSQNKAILVFTGVTIVFLPLSFFTSYYGMNLRGIANTSKTENYFWAVCGTVGFFLVLVTVLIAFRHKLELLFRRTMSDEGEEDNV